MSSPPHPIDIQVGAAVRRERQAAGLSQKRLALAIGVSFQQLQKYERGIDRISASALFFIGKALQVRPASFFGREHDAEFVAVDPSLVAQLHRLSPEGRETVRSVLSALNDPPG